MFVLRMPSLIAMMLLAVSNPYLDEAKRLAKELKFAEAIEQLKVAKQVPGHSDAEQVAVLDLLARCQVAEGRRADAQSSFEELLVLAPSFQPDRSLSPKILETFDAAKTKVFARDYFKLEPLASPPGRARLKVIDPWRRAGAYELSMRVDGEPTWSVTPLTVQDGVLEVELQAAPLHTLEWYVTARDAAGATVASYGTAQEPQRHFVPDVAPGGVLVVERETPRLERWPGWVAMALGLVFEGLGAAFEVISQNTVRQLEDRTMLPGSMSAPARAAYADAQRNATFATIFFVVGGVAGSVGVLVFAW